MTQTREVLLLLSAILAGAGVLLDLASLVLALRRNRLGTGPSGVAGVAWFGYLGFCIARQQFLWLVAFTAFHASCHFLIPMLHRRLTAPEGS